MRHIFYALVLLFLFVCAQTGAWAADGNSGDVLMTRLANGLTVYIQRDARFPLVCTRLYVRAGSANEAAAQAGISHVLEHMVFKGTEHRPKGQVARDVEALGGYLNAATSFDKTWYITDMPAAHWRTGMDVVRDMAFQATLDPAELEAEKNVVISELQRGEDSPMRRLFENLQVAALANTPYGRPIIGFEDAIRKLTVQDLRDYVKRWYQPRNMFLLVIGDIVPQEVLSHAGELFGALSNHGDLNLPQPLDLADASGGPLVEVTRGPWGKVYLGVAFPVPGLRDMRSMELDVLSFILGGDGASEFYRKYKYDEQLVDDISVDNMSLFRAGMLSITARLDADKVEKFWQELTRDLAGLPRLDVGGDALSRARFNIIDSMDRSGETLNGLAAWKGLVEFDLGGEQAEMNMRFALENVDQEQLRGTAATWIVPGRARVRVMAPQHAELPDFGAIMTRNWYVDDPGSMPASASGASAREVIDLGAGRRLILNQDRTVPYLAMQFMMAGGNALLKPEQQGLADLCARLLTDGSGELGAQAVERWFSERAASVSAQSGLQTFGIAMSGPERFDTDLFEMLRKILEHPRFEQTELKREVGNMESALRQRMDNPLSYLFSKLNPFLFPGGQPYGYDTLGTAQTIGAFSRDDVVKFWRIQSGMPWVLSVAGSYDREAVIDMARRLPGTGVAPPPSPVPAWGRDRRLALVLPGRNQAHLLQVFRTVSPTSADAPAIMLLQSVLSGQSGLLFSRLRDEKGLGYTVTAFNRNMPETGFMAFYIGTTPEKLGEAREGFSRVIADLRKRPLDKGLLAAGANRLLGDYLRDRQSLASRASEAALDSIMGYPPDFQKQLVNDAAGVTPDQVMNVARRYLQADNLWEATLLP